MSKTLYICGDSFCSSDPKYGDNWVDLLTLSYPNINIINLSSVGASNYLIYLQVKHALAHNCDYLIYNATSSVRQEFSLNSDTLIQSDNVSRYWNAALPSNDKSMICASWNTVAKNTANILTIKKINIIQEFFKEAVDLPNLIEKNYIFILFTLQLLDSTPNLTWAWSQGGFEHKSFNPTVTWDFSKYILHECPINLWDEYDNTLIRPYYHITDTNLIENVYIQYAKMLNL
jgi:hypothetical protein